MTDPRCPYFGECGGCSAQHIDYAQQVENKRKLVADATGFSDVTAHFGEPYEYRNRMDLIFHPTGIGFRRKGKWWSIVDIEKCVISEPRLNELIAEVRSSFSNVDYFDIKKTTGTFRYAVIRVAPEGDSISFVLNSDSSRIKEAVERIKEFASTSSADNIVVTYAHSKTDMSISSDYFVVKGKDTLEATYLGKTFRYSVQGFFQNNHAMAEKLQEYVRSLLSVYETNQSKLLDLYGGVGTFGIVNADLFESVMSVEEFEGSTVAAKENAQLNNLDNFSAVTLDAKQLRKIVLDGPLYVITDPPRSGMHPKTILQLNTLQPEVIVYVSCNPSQLRKELHQFSGYTIKSVAMFDLFPQTPHAEAVVELIKEK